MQTEKKLNEIEEIIRKAAPEFDPAHALEALKHTDVYLFRYFPKLKMIVLTERLCSDFDLQPVYYDMPDSFAADFVAENDRLSFKQMYYDINAGHPTASGSFKDRVHNTRCHVTLSTVEWDADHNPELCTCVVEDRTKEDLFKEELNAILSSISCGILQYRQSDNKLLRVNKAALEILGYETIEELAADREYGVAKTVLPEDRRHIKELADSLRYSGDIKSFEYRVLHPGSDRIIYCYGTVQMYDNVHGERTIQRTIMDVTDRKVSEDMQQTNNDLMQRLDSVMSGITGGFEIMLDDPAFTYVFLSEGVAALQGYTVSELLEKCNGSALENIYPDDRDAVLESLKSVTPESDAYAIKYRLLHKDGSLIWVSETGKKVMDRDGICQCYCLIQDITESQKRAEELNHLLTMQRQMVSSLGCGVLAYSYPEREVLIVNKETRRIFRYDKEDPRPLVETMADHILPEDLENIRQAIKNLQKVGDSCTFRIHPMTEFGSRLTVECISKLRAFDDGKQFILSVLSDITKLEERTYELNQMNVRQTEMLSAIRRERQQYRNALVSDCEYAYRLDVTEGRVISDFDHSTKGSLIENLGISTPVSFDKLVQYWQEKMQADFLTPDGQNLMTAEDIKACYERGMKHIVTEYYSRKQNRYYRRTLLLSMDDETEHLWAVAIINDITDTIREETRKRSELAQINRELNDQIGISKAFSSIYFATWEVDLETKQMQSILVPQWAEQVEEMSQGSYSNATEMMITSFIEIEWRDAMREFLNIDNMAMRLKNESILSCECRAKHYGWSTTSLIPLVRDEAGDVTSVILAVREIGNEKRKELEAKQALEEAYEAANRANAAKTDFLSSMSHDIRTPMNGIIGMTAIAGTHLDDKERVADCLSKISVSSKHLLGLINEVLDMNKIESGKLDLNAEQFPLSELIDTLMVMFKPQVESKNHTLTVNIQNIEHEYVIGDSMRLQQIFSNLLSNAIKYTPEGGTIKLNLNEKATNNPKIGCYEFIIEDNGIGMSAEFQEKLFEPFSRAKDRRVEKIQGSGLGMPIARNIVRMMNGDIQVESELSKGTKFTVTIYLELQETEETVSLEDLIHLPILVTDDDVTACESTCAVLAELGMDGEWVLTGEEAVEKTVARHAQNDDYFAVILDWKMPGMDGLATAKEIRRQIGEDLPIIIISAYDWSDIEQEARSAGVSAFISKPVFKSRLSYLFKNLLAHTPENQNTSVLNDLSERHFDGKRALLAEDNELNAEIAMEFLKTTGLEIDCAPNGKEAVNMITSHPEGYYDIVFMDVQMPVMNGYEATKAIRSLPGTYEQNIPIIAMTANAFAEDVQAAKNAGMNEHIAKPLNIGQLTKSLDRWLR